MQARLFNTTSPIIEPAPEDAPRATQPPPPISPNSSAVKSSSPISSLKTPSEPPITQQPFEISESVRALLPALKSQPEHYITLHIHNRPYLVTPGDEIRLPFKMPGVLLGDVLRLNRATVIASRDLTLKGAPYIDDRFFECRATVLGVESEPLRIKEKKKQRNRRVKRVKSKHRYTILRISELKINSLDEIEA
jgi:large subunit ribosomal protein L21